MATRGRGYNQAQDWDPMKEDYDNSNNYDQDDNESYMHELDHRRLYIKNIPKGLNDDGLRAAFANYGTLTEAYVSKDPLKRYGLVAYETAAEARLAKMKLNNTEPLRFKIDIAHKKRVFDNNTTKRGPKEESSSRRERDRDDRSSKGSHTRERDDRSTVTPRYHKRDELANGDNNILADLGDLDDSMGLESLNPDIQLELEKLQLEQLELQQQQVMVKQKILMKQAISRRQREITHSTTPSSRCVLPGGRVVVRQHAEGEQIDGDSCFTTGAGDSNERERDTPMCSCKSKKTWDQAGSSDDRSTPSTCILCSEDPSVDRRTDNRDYKKRERSKYKKPEIQSKKSDYSKFTDKATDLSRNTTNSKMTDMTSKKSDYSKFTDSVDKRSEMTSKKLEIVHRKLLGKKSETTWDLKYTDLYTDSEDEADETNRLIQLRSSDYLEIVEDSLKIVLALAGYPKSKMGLRQMSQFQRCLNDVMDMQLKAGLLRKVPSFLDYYLNKGAIVCICKDVETRNWMVRVCPGLQERMDTNLILLKANVKRLCLAILKIPKSCWPATAQDAFKLIQYFNPTLKTQLWKIYAQKTVDNVECTSVLLDRVSGEIIRGPTFKNVIDYHQIEFELSGFSEIYYECLLSDIDEDLSSVASRVKLLEDIKSAGATPTNQSTTSFIKVNSAKKDRDEQQTESTVENKADEHETENPEFQKEFKDNLDKNILEKLKDVKYDHDKDEVIIWSDDNFGSDHEQRIEEDNPINSTYMSGVAASENTESIIESNDNLTMSRNSNLNIDTNRGIAYHRRTNYLHVENELKIAITLEGYPQNKLEGTHIRRLKHLFKEYLHKDMKNRRFSNLIIPKFQDIYLSNGAVIYICDSLETKDYLNEVLPKFINSTGLRLTFRDIKNLVRYTRIVMRLPKEHSHVVSMEILLKLQESYPGLKPDCWKYYSDVAGKQKRQFGVDPESLEVIKSPDFNPKYEGEPITFRIIDRQKRDVSFEEPEAGDYDIEATDDESKKKLHEKVLKSMYVPIDTEIMNAPLTRIRTNHYSDLIADDLKLFISPSNYPATRVDDSLFHLIKKTFENIVCEEFEKGEINDDNLPKVHDMYLFDGVIFVICQKMSSRRYIENSLTTLNSKLDVHLKSTEFRGAVGIVSMFVKTDKDTDEVISILQKLNPRLRTKYWRKISTVRNKSKLDVVLQVDKLSALVISNQNFNKYVGPNPVEFKLGHLQSLLKPKASLEALTKKAGKKKSEIKLSDGKNKSKVSMQGPRDKSFEDLKKSLKQEYPGLRIDNWDVISQRGKANHQVCDLEIDNVSAKIIENEDYKLSAGEEKVFFYTGLSSARTLVDVENADRKSIKSDISPPMILDEDIQQQDMKKMILKIPIDILPENKDDLNIIFDLLEDKNPGLNTELWQVFTEIPYPGSGKFTLLLDNQSASVVQGKNFDPTIGGEKLKFYY